MTAGNCSLVSTIAQPITSYDLRDLNTILLTMKQHLKDIRLGEGLGVLRFGATKDDVKQQLGAPSETERYTLDEDDDEDETEDWHYDELGISLSFEQIHGWRLSSIAVSDEEYTLEDISLIGRTKDDVLQEFNKRGWGTPQEDDVVADEGDSQSLYHIDEAMLSLWFEDDELTEVQWGPHMKAGEPMWPGERTAAQ